MIRRVPALLLVFIGSVAGQTALQSAIAAEKAGRTQSAIKQFHDILRATPAPEIAGQARLELVRIHQRRGEWWESAEQLRELRKLAPQEAEYAYQLGLAYQNLSKWAFERMRTIAPSSARTGQILAEQYSVRGEIDKAVAAYNNAIAADPKLAGSHLALAILYLRAGKREDAKIEIDRELEIAPESAMAKQVLNAIAGETP
jgi:tetratricopeptide (TPR) repeat protein